MPVDGPQGEPVPGPGEEAQPAGGADQGHLGLRQGLLRQRGEQQTRISRARQQKQSEKHVISHFGIGAN